jgi:TatA/E family protein of Tat protein translocase
VFDFSPTKILLIVVVTAVLLGPDKIPDVARSIGSAWRTLKRLQERVETEVRGVIPDLPDAAHLTRLARSPVHLLDELAIRSDQASGASTEPPMRVEPLGPAVTLEFRKPLVNPPVSWSSPEGPFDPSLN